MNINDVLIIVRITQSFSSYDRIQPNTWSGAYLCWGVENREAPLRAACPPGTPDGSISNFEIKAFDGCANPYLGLAAIMAAGIDGLRRHLSLPEPIGKITRATKYGIILHSSSFASLLCNSLFLFIESL